ncbi:unnamed protein product [Calypogeia fissa]
MVAMAFSAQCHLLGPGLALPPVRAPSISSSSTSLFAIPHRFVRIRASSSSSSSVADSSTDDAAASSAVPVSEPESAAVVSEPESAGISTLDIPPPAAPTSMSLVSRTKELVLAEGAAGLAQVDHYRVLKIPFGSSVEKIAEAYKNRVEELKALENEIGKEAVDEELRSLQVSYNILNSEEERKVYDWVLQRYNHRLRDTYIWPYETDITQRYTNKEPPPVMRSFDQEGNNRLGLFLLGWVIISIIFSATMNTWIRYPHYRNL